MTKPIRNESTAEARDFWRVAREAAERLEHRRNLAGKTAATCPACDGERYAEPCRTDYDSYGSYYVPPVDCRACAGRGMVEVPCAPEVEAAAIRREIERLRERLAEVEHEAL